MSGDTPNFWLYERYGDYVAVIRDPETSEIRLATDEDFEKIPTLRQFRKAAQKALDESFVVPA